MNNIMDNIISENDSEITHVLALNGKVEHVIQKTVMTTLPSAPKYPGFVLIKKRIPKDKGQ